MPEILLTDELAAPTSDADTVSPRVPEAVQARWASTPVEARLRVLRRARHRIAADPLSLARSIPCEVAGSLHRSFADSLIAEVLPLLEACRFLERRAGRLLAPEQLSTARAPFWLRGVRVEIRREALGRVLVIGPANYPLLLPGVQALQALAAGNAVLWKPAPGCSGPACALRAALLWAGLHPELLTVLAATPEAATEAIACGVDKVFLTGHARTGRTVLHACADTLTPAVTELSGADAVFVLPGADLERAAEAIAFGMRLNGSATCMAPRRLFAREATVHALLPKLQARLAALAAVPLPLSTRSLLRELLADAQENGASLLPAESDPRRETPDFIPTLVLHATAEMRIAQTDLPAPVLSVIVVQDDEEALRAHAVCPYALTASIFGPEPKAQKLAARLRVGTVLINDIIVTTADPRVPFGGRGESGFGVSRGREGLLEMTAVKAVVTQTSKSRRAYAATTSAHQPFFTSYIAAAHGEGLRARFAGLRQLVRAARTLEGPASAMHRHKPVS